MTADSPAKRRDSRAWPLVVTRNRLLDWRPIVAPDFMIAQGGEYLLVHGADPGDGPSPSPVFERIVTTERYGDLTLLARSRQATADLIGGSPQEQLLDRTGRPIQLIEGLVLPWATPRLHSPLARPACPGGRHRLPQAFPDFWRSEDEAEPPAPSLPLTETGPSAKGDLDPGQVPRGRAITDSGTPRDTGLVSVPRRRQAVGTARDDGGDYGDRRCSRPLRAYPHCAAVIERDNFNQVSRGSSMEGNLFLAVISQVLTREVWLSVGEQLAAQPHVTGLLQIGDILGMSESNRAIAKNGEPISALTLQRLLFAAVQAKPAEPLEANGSNNVHYMLTTVGTDLLAIIHYEITRMPDGRLLRLACRTGDVALPHARYAEVNAPACRILRQIGALHLDPYVVGPQYQPPEDLRQRWLQRLQDERGDELLAVPSAELVMPAPLDALQTAVSYLRERVPLLEDHARGAALQGACAGIDRTRPSRRAHRSHRTSSHGGRSPSAA